MYHVTEYLLIAFAVFIISLGVGMFAESAAWGFTSAVFLFALLGIWMYVRESDI